MPTQFEFLPPIPRKAPAGAFHQSIRIFDERGTIGIALWYTRSTSTGVAQLIDLEIDPAHRRQGLGIQLFQKVVEQFRHLCKANHHPARRIWSTLDQKQQVIARAFVTRLAFHHMVSVKNLLDDEDAMIYMLSLD